MMYPTMSKGHLRQHWSEWFDCLTIMIQDNGDTLIAVPVADRATLYGALRQVSDAGIPLLSVGCVNPSQADVQADGSDIP